MSTQREDGYLVESGPDSFLTRKPETEALCRELGLADRFLEVNTNARRAFVARKGRLRRLPQGMSGLVPMKTGPLLLTGSLSPVGKLRLLLERAIPQRSNGSDESVASFFRRRFGAEAFNRLIEPLVSGIYAGDADELSVQAVLPQLAELEREHGSVTRGLKRSHARVDPSRPAFLSLSGGMTELVDALEAACRREDWQLGTTVQAVRKTERGFTVDLGQEELKADAVIVAMPTYLASFILRDVDSRLSSLLNGIAHVSTATVSLAYATGSVSRRLNGSGYLVPRVEGRQVLGCSWVSAKFPGRAPTGTEVFRIFIGRQGSEVDASVTDEALTDLAHEEMRAVMGASERPLRSWVFRHHWAMPQYTVGHGERVQEIEKQASSHTGLLLCGNWQTGVGISDCIRSATVAANSAADYLKGIG